MARKRRRQRARAEPGSASTAERARPVRRRPLARDVGMPDWRWRSFPVFAAFVSGMLLAGVIGGEPPNDAAAIVQLLALLGVAYAVAHLFVTNVIVAGRIRRRERQLAQAQQPHVDGDDDEWEDAVVHPDEEPTHERSGP